MNDHALIGTAEPDGAAGFRATLRAQGAATVVWGIAAFVLASGAWRLYGGPNAVQAHAEGVSFWSFVIAILTIEPVVSTAAIALLAVLLSRAGLGRFAVVLTVAVAYCAATSAFDRSAAVVLFVPLLVYGHLFVDQNEGRGDYARGFVVAWLAQWVFNVCVAISLVIARASG